MLNHPCLTSMHKVCSASQICGALHVRISTVCMYKFPRLQHRIHHSFIRTRGLEKRKFMMVEHRRVPVRNHGRYKIQLHVSLGPHLAIAAYKRKKLFSQFREVQRLSMNFSISVRSVRIYSHLRQQYRKYFGSRNINVDMSFLIIHGVPASLRDKYIATNRPQVISSLRGQTFCENSDHTVNDLDVHGNGLGQHT